MKAPKLRLDELLVERGLAESAAKAQALVMAGKVFTGEQKLTSAGGKVASDISVTVRGAEHPWVSRGGLKLVHGLQHFPFDPKGRIGIDVGSSTGGFTDVLLTHGAAKVYSVDVGYGQLAHKLRTDPRVIVLERTNARLLDASHVPEAVSAIVCDASFIGLRSVLPASMALSSEDAWLIALIKPQFEVGRGEVGKGGVVRDPSLHQRVCGEVQGWLEDIGWQVDGIVPSPITGPEGNIEFLIAAHRM